MIRITNIQQCKADNYDEIYIITRSIVNLKRHHHPILEKAQHVCDLAPSKHLIKISFAKTRSALASKDATAQQQYKNMFIHEIKNNPTALKWLTYLQKQDTKGKRIALLCACRDSYNCYCSVIGFMLKDKNCTVRIGTDGW